MLLKASSLERQSIMKFRSFNTYNYDKLKMPASHLSGMLTSQSNKYECHINNFSNGTSNSKVSRQQLEAFNYWRNSANFGIKG
jgi:hypothetical protein